MPSSLFLAATVAAAIGALPSESFCTAPAFVPLAVPSPQKKQEQVVWTWMARSDNSRRTTHGRNSRGSEQGYGNGQDFDYSGGNLKYGTGKYTQRENDGFSGGVNLSKDGRSMQDSVYREDRHNVDRARGRHRMDGRMEDFGSRMDEIEDLERGMGRNERGGMGGRRNGPREGMRDRMMRNRSGGGGGRMLRDNRGGEEDMYDMDEFGESARERMGGGGLLRDLRDAGGRNRDGYDDFGSRGGGMNMMHRMSSGGMREGGTSSKVMGGSSNGRHGGYRSSQFESGLSNERRRYEEYGFRMNDYLDDRDGIIDFESTALLSVH